jgi:chromosome segregation protein
LRRQRRGALARDVEAWTRRCEGARKQIEELTAESGKAAQELETTRERPAALEDKLHALADRIDAAEETARKAREAASGTEDLVKEADSAARKAEADVEGLSADELERRLQDARNSRERLGAVNLRADEEAEELAGKVTEMERERDDLLAAIDRLRKAVDELSREGRARLLEAFEIVDGHFRQLFATLFEGGHAELRLTEADDPLEAGLEIFACPPGKKLETMSLMSGGEQALTASALIFAVFLSNPAPVCVLDEVDAPLDDANVDRYCRMLDHMRSLTETRFLVITHNPLTMSRVDRLFGVTMAERGVSQLVSVDLIGAEQLIAAE